MAQKILIFKFVIINFSFFVFSLSAQSQNLVIGKAKVIDGDTIHIGKNKIRLHGIDAPEIKQTCKVKNVAWNCGIESEKALKNLIIEKKVKCKIVDKDQYNRLIGICYVKNKNINQYLVQNGWAIAYRYYSLDYVSNEEFAKKNKIGIWKGSFEEPYLFRKKQKN
tara:strand:+ start:1291 stop:1785 length:495 start_codon:yes stop_codon:yes gene_type:complete